MGRWVLIPGLVFLAGLVLPVWATVADNPPGLRGLGYYPSAYLGDTVLIPTSTLLIVLAIRSVAAASREKAFVAVALVVATATATGVQASWLRDPHPSLNWTLPRPGHFNAVGWWHAIYFVAVSALFFGLTVLFLVRVFEAKRKGVRLQAGPWMAVFFAATSTYLALAVHDSTSGKISLASGSSLALIGVALALTAALTIPAYGKSARILVRPALLGLASATALATLTVGSRPPHLMPIETAAVTLLTLALVLVCDLASTLSAPMLSDQRAINALAIVVVCAAAWQDLSAETTRQELVRVLVAGAIAALVLVALIVGVLGRTAVRVLGFTVLYVFSIAVATTALWLVKTPSPQHKQIWILPIVVGLLMTVVTKAVKERSDYELGVPDEASHTSERLPEARVGRATLALALIVTFGLGAFLVLLALSLAANPGISLPTATSFDGSDQLVAAAAAIALLVAIALFAASVRWRHSARMQLAIRQVMALAPIVLSVLIVIALPGHPVKGLIIITALCATPVAALWTFNSLLSNVWLLQGRAFVVSDWFPVLSLTVLSASMVAWTLTAGTRTSQGSRAPLEAVTIVVTALLLMIALTTLLGGTLTAGTTRLTELPAWRNLLQDGFSISAIVMIIVFPSTYMISNAGWEGLKLAVPLATFFALPFNWIMKANRQWPEIEARRLLPTDEATRLIAATGKRSWQLFTLDLRTQRKCSTSPCTSPHSEEFIRSLGAHTRHQNRLAAAMIISALIGTLTVAVALLSDSGLLEEILRKYSRPPIP